MRVRTLFLFFFFTLSLLSCKKESDNTINVAYQLETSGLTGDHFFVSYVIETGDTITEHQHPGWNYSFSIQKPFSTYLKAEVIPIDSYDFSIKIVVDGNIAEQASASTASGAKQVISISHTAN